MINTRTRWLVCLLTLSWAGAVDAQAPAGPDLADLTLEELANMAVTSVFLRPEPLADAPTSIFVISGDDIRRSGASTLAEALRLAPNLQVARVDARGYAISARGFNNAIGNKLLVLVDGRTIYSPVFSGVFWDQQDVMLEDVERIEVISGPGGTQWGANAMNGVINVITRAARATQGALVTVTEGEQERVAAARFGGRLADAAYRFYAKGSRHEATLTPAGASAGDAWRRWQAGFRAGWGEPGREATLIGEVYEGKAEATAAGVPRFSGASLLARWSRRLGDGSDVRLQAYVDEAERDDLVGLRDRVRTYDLEAQHALALGSHKVVWGGGYRWARDVTERTLLFVFIPERRDLRWGNLFVQDTVDLGEGVQVTAGVKLESNVYTGWEVLPSLRLAWKPDSRQLLWGALSRAVRAPARLDRDFRFPGNPPFLILGGPEFESELAEVAEVGYRTQPTAAASLSVAAFYGDYDKLRSGQPAPAFVQNMIEGEVSGVEAWASWQATPWWRLGAGLTALRERLRLKPGSTDPTGPRALGNDPRSQWTLRSSFTFPYRIELDVNVRRVGELPDPRVPAYTAVDARLGWRITRSLELSVGVRQGLDADHVEFGAPASARRIARDAFAKLAWRL